ncbi:SurA N-terminal domain-containing protein [Treponema sp. Marseille-Q4130]|uniref:SurA N-terminal domain-containing protein n=1 Tax=Treponema sp. Marseille-Q4130 TaxID=2766702 RepID=UPI0016525CDB|nr:SurA N-terminal domain-containing protein [Treponema sp. Marseille-Q4130]MBC6719580.1 SurA N-terminal domain-containing protein [Treponema sp. Marseille-Q4130]
MKKGFYTVGLIVVLAISAFAFILAPAMVGHGDANTLPPFGSYDGKKIKYEQGSDFANYVSRYAEFFQAQGRQIDPQSNYYIFNYAFNAVVQKIAYTQAVAESGYAVPQSAVNRAMLPYFSDENGNYSQRRYRETPASEIESMQKNFREDLTMRRYNDDMFGSSARFAGSALYGLKSSENEIAFFENFGTEKRGFDMASFNTDDYPDSEREAYGRANAKKFIKYDMSIITCGEKSKAETVAKRLKNNEITFEDAVNEYSSKNYSDANGKLTNSYRYEIERIIKNSDDVEKIVSLAKDATSAVIETNIGFSVFHADGSASDPDFTNEQIVKDVWSYLRANEAGRIEDYFTDVAKNFGADAAVNGFAAAAQKAGAKDTALSPFPLNYGSVSFANSIDTSIEGLSGADTNKNFLQTAFSLKFNEISSPIVNGKTVLVLQYTNEVKDEPSENAASLAGQIASSDESSASSHLMASPKLKNDLFTVYFNYFMNTGNTN